MTTYRRLRTIALKEGCVYHWPQQGLAQFVNKDDPAIVAMTDLTRLAAITIQPDVNIDVANDKMIANGVRLLVVTDDSNNVLGIITAADILGEKPLQYLQTSGGERSTVLVKDIMTAIEEMDALPMFEVAAANVGDIVVTLIDLGLQHAIVVEPDKSGNHQTLRGIFSATHIGKLLGAQIETTDIAKTFAEIQKVVNAD